MKMASSPNRKRTKRSTSGAGRKYPGDPPTDRTTESPEFLGVEDSPFKGVRARVLMEIKPWPENATICGGSFLCEVKLSKAKKSVGMAKLAGALIHDVARAYSNPDVPVDQLNITSVEICIRRDVLKEEIIDKGRFIGKDELDKYMQKCLPITERKEWKDLDKAGFISLKKEIEKHGLEFYEVLTDAINKDIPRAGRRRKDKAQILDSVQHVEESDPKEKEIQDLKERMSFLEVTHAAELRAKDEEFRAKVAELRAEYAELRAKDTQTSSLNEKSENRNSGTGELIPNLSPDTDFENFPLPPLEGFGDFPLASFSDFEDSILPDSPVLDAECVQDHDIELFQIAKEISRVGCERQGEAQILDLVQHGEERDPKEGMIQKWSPAI